MEATTISDLDLAIKTYTDRRDRLAHPSGSFDRAGRFYPDTDEWRHCCAAVRGPSRAYPYAYMLHCRTLAHVAALYGVDAGTLRAALRAVNPRLAPKREGGDHYYKAVALIDGRMWSIYNQDTEYVIGQTLAEQPRRDHGGGYYAYPTLEQACQADVPEDSANQWEDRVVIRCRAEGSYCRYHGGKIAFSRLTPLEVVGALVEVDYNAETWHAWPTWRLVPMAEVETVTQEVTA